MALRAGYFGIKKVLPVLKMIRPGILDIDYTALNSELSKTFFKRSEQKVLGAVNLIETNLTAAQDVGVSYVRNADGTITCTNQATGSGGLKVTKNFTLTGMMPYKITGCPAGGGNTTFKLVLRKASDNSYVNEDNGNGFIIIPAATTEYYLQVRYQQGYTANQTFKPMVTLNLNAIYDDYAPYAMTNQELTASATDWKTAINAIITAATGAADFAAFKAAMEAITPVTRSLSKEASPEDVPEEVIEEKPVTKKTTKKTVKEGE